MERSLYCQICCVKHEKLHSFRQHLRSQNHQQMLQDLFPSETICCKGSIPYIVFLNTKMKSEIKQPVGLSLLTLCFSQNTTIVFYLCHICETRCPQEHILRHIHSLEHCFNYFVYTNPDVVRFAWKPDMNIKNILWKTKRESRNSELQNLQVMHLPAPVLKKLVSSTYSEVMETFGENSKLVERFIAMHKKRVSFRDYLSNPNRSHPILGVQHVVECVCFEPGQKTFYLCTLCCLVLPNHMIIKHVLSFDHLHSFLKAWHPSTLISKESYKDYDSFGHIVLDIAKQAEKIQAAKNVSMQQVNLQLDDFKSVNFKSYAQALNSLESITKSNLTTTVKPGNKLEYQYDPVSNHCWLCCQNCGIYFSHINKYLNHVKEKEHIEMMQKSFLEAGSCYGKRGKVYVGLYPYIRSCLKSNQPPVGTSLVVTCLSWEADANPFYVCFACQDSFRHSTLSDHFDSRKHLISTQLYHNPWLLPFGWDGVLDDKALRWNAWKEEQNITNRLTLKICDIPYSVFMSLDPSNYNKVINRLGNDILRNEVPLCKTYSKQNEKFPFLGLQFLVVHNLAVRPNVHQPGALCLLCERRLNKEEIEAHFFSREHVSKFLDCFHPGSLDSQPVDTETLLDLAKQAAKLHSQSKMQIMSMGCSIWEPCTYSKAKNILSAAKWRTEQKSLVPPIKPKLKLVSRISPKKADKQDETDDKTVCSVSDAKETGKNKEEAGGSGTNTASTEGTVATEKQESEKVCPMDIKNEGKTDLSVKLKTEKPREKVSESSKNVEKKNALTKQAGPSSTKVETTQLKDGHQKSERKRPSSLEKSPDESRQSGCRLSPKRQRLTSKDGSGFKESPEMSSIRMTVQNTEMAKEDEKHKEVMDKVGRTCVEWCCDKLESIYLCGHCLLKIPKKDITSHLEGADHPEMVRLVVHLGEETYSTISKQNLKPESLYKFLYEVIKKELTANPSLDSRSFPTCSQTDVTPNSTSAGPQSQQEVRKKVEHISVESGAAAVATYKPGQGKPSHTCSAVPRSSKDGKTGSGSSPQSTKNESKAVSPKQAKSLAIEAAAKPEQPRAVISSTSTNTFRSTTASCRPTKTASSTSEAPTIQSPTTSILPKSQRVTTSTATCSVPASAKKGSAETHKPEPPLKCGKTKPQAPQPLTTKAKGTAATSKTDKPQVTSINPGPSAKTMTGGSPVTETAAHKRKLPASSHQNPEEIKKLRKDLPPVAPIKTKPSGNLPQVGKNQLILVSCKEKQQVYCLLCGLKLNSSSLYHLTSSVHQFKYVRMKYPEMSVKELGKQLNQTVSRLAEFEKTWDHTRRAQKLEVEMDEYQKLGHLPDILAFERVKALVKQRDLRVLSSPTIDSTAPPCLDVSSPCDVSSSGISAFHDEMSDSADSYQPEQNKSQRQASLDQTSEMGPTLAAGQSGRDMSSDEEDLQVVEPEKSMQTDPQQILDQHNLAEDTTESDTILKCSEKHCPAELQRQQSSNGKDMEAQHLIQDQRPSVSSNKIIPDPLPDSGAEDVTEIIQLDPSQHKDKHLTESHGLTPKNVDQLPTAERQPRKKDTVFQEPQQAVACAEKASRVKDCSFELEVTAGQQSQSGLRHHAEPAATVLQPEQLSTSQPNVFGRRAQSSSNLSHRLKATQKDPTQVVGMDYVWECWTKGFKTFYLCEICEKMLSIIEICQHMVSLDHHLKYLGREDPRFLKMFWLEDNLPKAFKMEVLKEVIQLLSEREQFHKLDARCILLRSESQDLVRTASFSEALKIVKNIADGHEHSAFPLAASAGHQKSERQQKGQQAADSKAIQSHLTASLSAPVPEKNQRSETTAQNPEKSHSKKKFVCSDERSSRTNFISSSSEIDDLVLPDQIGATHVSHPEPISTPAQQPELKMAASQLKLNPSPLEVKSSSSSVCPVLSLSPTVGLDPSQEPCSSSMQPHDKSSVSQIEGTTGPLELFAPHSEANPIVPSSSLNSSQETRSGRPLLPEFNQSVSQLGRNSSSPDTNSSNSVADVLSSSSATLNQQTCSVPSQQPQFSLAVPRLPSSDLVQLSESTSTVGPNLEPVTKVRPSDSLVENLFKTSFKEPQPVQCIEAPKTCESEPSCLSVLPSSSGNAIIGKPASMGPHDWKMASDLLSYLKRTNHGQSASNPAESRELIIFPLTKDTDFRNPPTAINQLPINTIITPRPHQVKPTHTDVGRHQLLHCQSDPTPSPASGGVYSYGQAAYPPAVPPTFAPAQSHFIYQQCIYPSQPYPPEPVNPFGLHSFEYSVMHRRL